MNILWNRPATAEPRVGMQVSYRCVNLMDHRGVITEIGTQPRGGDCVVKWTRPMTVTSVECWMNLAEVVND